MGSNRDNTMQLPNVGYTALAPPWEGEGSLDLGRELEIAIMTRRAHEIASKYGDRVQGERSDPSVHAVGDPDGVAASVIRSPLTPPDWYSLAMKTQMDLPNFLLNEGASGSNCDDSALYGRRNDDYEHDNVATDNGMQNVGYHSSEQESQMGLPYLLNEGASGRRNDNDESDKVAADNEMQNVGYHHSSEQKSSTWKYGDLNKDELPLEAIYVAPDVKPGTGPDYYSTTEYYKDYWSFESRCVRPKHRKSRSRSPVVNKHKRRRRKSPNGESRSRRRRSRSSGSRSRRPRKQSPAANNNRARHGFTHNHATTFRGFGFNDRARLRSGTPMVKKSYTRRPNRGLSTPFGKPERIIDRVLRSPKIHSRKSPSPNPYAQEGRKLSGDNKERSQSTANNYKHKWVYNKPCGSGWYGSWGRRKGFAKREDQDKRREETKERGREEKERKSTVPSSSCPPCGNSNKDTRKVVEHADPPGHQNVSELEGNNRVNGGNEVPPSSNPPQHSSGPTTPISPIQTNTVEERMQIMKTCREAGCTKFNHTFLTREAARHHLQKAHGLKHCDVCLITLPDAGLEHLRHFISEHATATVPGAGEMTCCPICSDDGKKYTYRGIYLHLCKMHYVPLELIIKREKTERDRDRDRERESKDVEETEI